MTSEFLEGAIRVGIESLERSDIIASAEDKERLAAWELASKRFQVLFSLTAFVMVSSGAVLSIFAALNLGHRSSAFEVRDILIGASVTSMGIIVYLLFASYNATVGIYTRAREPAVCD